MKRDLPAGFVGLCCVFPTSGTALCVYELKSWVSLLLALRLALVEVTLHETVL